MRSNSSLLSSILHFATLFVIFQACHSITDFHCPKSGGDPLPYLPSAYSTNIRLNYAGKHYTVEARKVVNVNDRRESLELWAGNRHVKYIIRYDLDQLLLIKYNKDERATCTVQKLSNSEAVLEDEDSGPNEILLKFNKTVHKPNNFVLTDLVFENGMFVKKWEACFVDPKINVSLAFAGDDGWTPWHTSSIQRNKYYLVQAEAQISDNVMTAQFSRFDATKPDDAEFQPPENVFCDGYRPDKKLPVIPDYFSYDAEIIVYESSEGIAPLVSYRKVYYDYPAGISRTDFYDPLAEDQDLFAPVRAQLKSIIHDFNSGVQYDFDPLSGKCTLDKFQTTFGVISAKETKDNMMLSASKYFSFDAAKTSYNGEFSARGVPTDVFSASVAEGKDKNIVTWYFSTDRIQVVESENVEKNVLLRMLVRPEAGSGKEGEALVNFFNFVKEEPSALTYDLTSCYNGSSIKKLVLTFPANDLLRGSEKLVKVHVHQSIKDATGISKQRIFVNEVSFDGKYMYAEFKMLDKPPVVGKVSKPLPKELSLDEALDKLKESISRGNFSVTIRSKEDPIVLRPEPNGLNVFAGDRDVKPTVVGYKEGGVIVLTIGMLFLGIVLGAVTINLIISRKFGVSLFQKKAYGDSPFNNPVDESSM